MGAIPVNTEALAELEKQITLLEDIQEIEDLEGMQPQGVIEVAPDGRTARGRWYTPSFESRPFGGTQKQTWQFGVYDNEYIKENGRWYFKKLHWNLTFWTSYERGFLKVPKLSDTSFPHADAPATAYHPYPSGHHVPYPFKPP